MCSLHYNAKLGGNTGGGWENKNIVKIVKKKLRITKNSDPKLLPLPRMPAAGLEPARGRPRQILSLMRLPFRHIRVSRLLQAEIYCNTQPCEIQHLFY